MKTSYVPSASATKIIVTLCALFAAIASAADSPTPRCPNPNPVTQQRDPDHFYSDAERNRGDKAPNQCDSCQDVTNARDKACNVYNFLHSPACLDRSSCTNSLGSFTIYNKPSLRYALERITSKPCHVVVFALDPVIGVEDANHRGDRNFWNHAYSASQKLISPAIDPGELGLAINPATRRGQHQLHIHIGKLPWSYRQGIDQLAKHQDFRSVSINGIDYRVAYVPDPSGPFSALSPFELVSNAYGERFMPREGILVARSKDRKGWFVLAALDKFVEGQLDYTTHQCTMAPPP